MTKKKPNQDREPVRRALRLLKLCDLDAAVFVDTTWCPKRAKTVIAMVRVTADGQTETLHHSYDYNMKPVDAEHQACLLAHKTFPGDVVFCDEAWMSTLGLARYVPRGSNLVAHEAARAGRKDRPVQEAFRHDSRRVG